MDSERQNLVKALVQAMQKHDLSELEGKLAGWFSRSAQIPRGHIVRILDGTNTPEERAFRVQKAVEAGWSRNTLVARIGTKLFERQGKAATNFQRVLPPPHSDLAQQTLKDPYVFGFLGLEEGAQEREIEHAMMIHIRDLLFYHLRLRCCVVVELKAGELIPNTRASSTST
jgi:predicted nuclease of restriction endonuclease-like (RecB) superfamily